MDEKLKKDLYSLGEIQEKLAKEYEEECENYWSSLSEEDRLRSFYSVCKRIHNGEIENKGSYRYVLYTVFGFGPEAYSIGMECGFLDIHNSIVNYD